MKKLIAIFCIMLLAVFTFAACSSKKESTKEQTQNIRVGEVTHSLFYAPLYVGIEKEFFKELDKLSCTRCKGICNISKFDILN